MFPYRVPCDGKEILQECIEVMGLAAKVHFFSAHLPLPSCRHFDKAATTCFYKYYLKKKKKKDF